jgi:predicted secreted protein
MVKLTVIFSMIMQRLLKIPLCMLIYFLIVQNLGCAGTIAMLDSMPQKNIVRLSRQDSGRQITVKVDDVIEIELEAPGGTGYTWSFDGLPSDYFDLIEEETKAVAKPGLTGGPVLKNWKLKAKSKGTAIVKLNLYKAWEGKEKSADSFTLEVKIQGRSTTQPEEIK